MAKEYTYFVEVPHRNIKDITFDSAEARRLYEQRKQQFPGAFVRIESQDDYFRSATVTSTLSEGLYKPMREVS